MEDSEANCHSGPAVGRGDRDGGRRLAWAAAHDGPRPSSWPANAISRLWCCLIVIAVGLCGCPTPESPANRPAAAEETATDPLAGTPGRPQDQGLSPRDQGLAGDRDPAGEVAQRVVRLRVVHPSLEPVAGQVAWSEGMTVFDVMQGFSPSLDVISTGQGESLFVKSIAGQANLGASGDNWIYRVNGELGDRSCGVYPVSPGDEIVWSFGKYQ